MPGSNSQSWIKYFPLTIGLGKKLTQNRLFIDIRDSSLYLIFFLVFNDLSKCNDF